MSKFLTLNTGHQIPMVGFGTWKLKPDIVGDVVRTALDTGYRHVDCAFAYENERAVGAALKEAFSSGKVKREDLFITSKLWNTGHSKDEVKPFVKDSLAKLGLDYLDLYLIHWPMAFKWSRESNPRDELFPKDEEGNVPYIDVPIMETWTALEQCVDEGLVRSIGFSNFNSQQIQHIIDNGRIKPAVLQIEVHPFLSQEKLVKFCQERGLTVTAYSPLGSADRPWGVPGEPVVLDDPTIKQLADKYKRTAAQVIMRWLIQRDIVTIPKSATTSRIKENFQLYDFELSEDDMKVMGSLNRNFRLMDFYVMKDGKQHFTESEYPNFPHLTEF